MKELTYRIFYTKEGETQEYYFDVSGIDIVEVKENVKKAVREKGLDQEKNKMRSVKLTDED